MTEECIAEPCCVFRKLGVCRRGLVLSALPFAGTHPQ